MGFAVTQACAAAQGNLEHASDVRDLERENSWGGLSTEVGDVWRPKRFSPDLQYGGMLACAHAKGGIRVLTKVRARQSSSALSNSGRGRWCRLGNTAADTIAESHAGLHSAPLPAAREENDVEVLILQNLLQTF